MKAATELTKEKQAQIPELRKAKKWKFNVRRFAFFERIYVTCAATEKCPDFFDKYGGLPVTLLEALRILDPEALKKCEGLYAVRYRDQNATQRSIYYSDKERWQQLCQIINRRIKIVYQDSGRQEEAACHDVGDYTPKK